MEKIFGYRAEQIDMRDEGDFIRPVFVTVECGKYKIKPIKINIPKCYFPFGIETYKAKSILNMSLPKNNDSYNLNANIINLEKVLMKQLFSYETFEDWKKLDFLPTTKKGKYGDIILRTHMKGHKYITTNIEPIISWCDLKGCQGSCEIKAHKIWNTKTQWGIIWVVNEIKLIKK